jgi:hypothetical protein
MRFQGMDLVVGWQRVPLPPLKEKGPAPLVFEVRAPRAVVQSITGPR